MTTDSSFQTRAAKAGAWATAQNGAGEGLKFLIFLVMANVFLSKSEFGIVALANSFVMFAQIAGQLGLGTALIRKKNITDQHKTACFWVLIIFASVLSLALFVLSDVFANWAQEPKVAPVLRVLCVGMLMTFAGLTHQALLQRALKFRLLAIRALVSTSLGGIACIAAAFLGMGVWSLVILNLVTATSSTVLLWFSLDWRPSFTLPLYAIKELLPTGLNVTGIGLLRYISMSADRFIVGFFISIADLGLLFVSQRIVQALQTLLTQSINAVTLPVFSTIQEDLPKVRRAYLKALQICIALTWPIFIGLALVSDATISLLLGSRWDGIADLVSVLAVAAAVSAPLYFGPPLLIAIGRSGVVLRVTTLGAVVQVICVALGAWYGLIGVVFGILVRQIIMSIVWMFITARILKIEKIEFLRLSRGSIASLAIMSGAIFLFMRHSTEIPELLRFLICTVGAIIVYMCSMRLLDKAAANLIIQLVNRVRE